MTNKWLKRENEELRNNLAQYIKIKSIICVNFDKLKDENKRLELEINTSSSIIAQLEEVICELNKKYGEIEELGYQNLDDNLNNSSILNEWTSSTDFCSDSI